MIVANQSGTFTGAINGGGTISHYGALTQTFSGVTFGSTTAFNNYAGTLAFSNSVLAPTSAYSLGALVMAGPDATLQSAYSGYQAGNILSETFSGYTARPPATRPSLPWSTTTTASTASITRSC